MSTAGSGAMLTMIAQTVLPEACFKGGSIIGFSTLLGFLAAIFLKTLEKLRILCVRLIVWRMSHVCQTE